MSTSSKIEWTETTWNPIAGCTPVSAGCRNCYAANHARRLAGNPNPKVSKAYEGTARTAGDGRAVFTGRVNLMPERLEQPLRWRKPRRVFVNSMSDLFHEDVPTDFIDQVFAIMALASRHTFQILTKRPERMAEYVNGFPRDPMERIDAALDVLEDELLLDADDAGVWAHNWIHGWSNPVSVPQFDGPTDGSVKRWPLPNVWLGTSTEDQCAADERIPHLLRTPAAVRFLSCEPLLGPVDLRPYVTELKAVLACPRCGYRASSSLYEGLHPRCPDDGHELVGDFGVDWVIIGGESGPRSRPCNVEWIRSLVRQCQEAGVPAFVKQLGAQPQHRVQLPLSDGYGGDHAPGWTSRPELLALEDRKGGDPEEWPEDLRVRQWPKEEPCPQG